MKVTTGLNVSAFSKTEMEFWDNMTYLTSGKLLYIYIIKLALRCINN
jgi:hypothetical protein